MKTIILVSIAIFCSIIVEAQTCDIAGDGTIGPNQTKSYSVTPTLGASQFWSVIGGASIVGSNTGTSVSVKAGAVAGTVTLCMTKYKAGNAPCCNCKAIDIQLAPGCPPQPSIYLGACGGYPSQHPHWRFGVLEQLAYDNTGTYSWTGTNFTFDTNPNQEYVIGRPTSAGLFTVYCTVTYNTCIPSGSVTYNLSFTYNTGDCGGINAASSISPNPFTDSATIQYELPEDGTVTIAVINQDGELVSTPVTNENKKKGKYSLELGAKLFPKVGLYICDVYFNNSLLFQERLIKQ